MTMSDVEPTASPVRAGGLRGLLSVVPEGTIAVGAGLAVTGIASYAYLAVGSRALNPDGTAEGAAAFAGLSVLWFSVFLVGGALLPFEQEVSRRIVARCVNGQGGRPVVVRAVTVGLGLIGVLAVLTLAAFPILRDRLFNGDGLLVVGLLLGMAGYLTANLSEGVLSGNGRFRRYGAFLAIESSLRLVICVACYLVGFETAGPYGLALGIAPLTTALILLAGRRELVEPGPPLALREFAKGLGALLAAGLLAQALINASPVLVQLFAGDRPQETAVFSSALLVARVPLFLFQAVQAALLPKLSGMAARDELAAFAALVKRFVLSVAALVVTGTLFAAAIGPPVVEAVFKYEAERRTVTMLALGSGGYIVATALALAVIALGGARLVMAGWGIGVATMIVVALAAGPDPLFRVELAFVSATAAATVAMALLLRRCLRHGGHLEQGTLLDALNDIPFEA